MWQVFALASLCTSALQNVADKWAIVSDRSIDTSVASFWRNGLFFLFTLLIGAWGYFGAITWHFDALVILLAVGALASAHMYTYMLRHVEVTGIQIDCYLLPLVLLGIDMMLLNAGLSVWQAAGVIFLAIGGFLFAVDGKTHHLKREFTWGAMAIIVYWVIFTAFQYYIFKHLNAEYGLNSVSFAASVHVVVVALGLLVVVLRGQYWGLFRAASAKYIVPVAISKAFDAFAEILMYTALIYASASQVSAIGALLPLVLFVVAYVVQKTTRFNIRERIDRANVRWKLFAVALLCAGMFLVG